jgi:hypothetical protein
MEEKVARHLANQIAHWGRSNPAKYHVEPLQIEKRLLNKFHQWVNGKQVVAGFEVVCIENHERYFLLFIDWHRNSNYYLVVYNAKKTTTVCEIQTVVTEDDVPSLIWKYNPLKRDGKNAERKAYFRELTGSTEISIPLSKTGAPAEMELFMDRLFKLCQVRQRADKVAEIFKEG